MQLIHRFSLNWYISSILLPLTGWVLSFRSTNFILSKGLSSWNEGDNLILYHEGKGGTTAEQITCKLFPALLDGPAFRFSFCLMLRSTYERFRYSALRKQHCWCQQYSTWSMPEWACTAYCQHHYLHDQTSLTSWCHAFPVQDVCAYILDPI